MKIILSDIKKSGRVAVVAMVLLVAGFGVVVAQDGGFGAGIILGEPTGLSAKLWMSRSSAFDFAAAWSFYRNSSDGRNDEGALYLHADYLHHFFGAIDVEQGKLVPYVGIGGKVVFAEDFYMGVRVPLGLTYMFAKVPLDVFLEISPAIALIPGTGFDVGGGIGVRYWFK